MKKKLETDLINIAQRIISLEGKVDVLKMHAEVTELYEKLTFLKFAKENFEDETPPIGNNSSFFGMLDSAFNNKVSDNIEVEDKTYVNVDDVEEDSIMEPGIETIKDMVAQMPYETQEVDNIFEAADLKSPAKKQDLDALTEGFKDMPVFDPVSKTDSASNERKSLNNKINTGRLNIGLNDKIAFIKHLFNGENDNYNRVISQLNTTASFDDAKRFIQDFVKPDYDEWQDKEEFEMRFLQIIESKFE